MEDTNQIIDRKFFPLFITLSKKDGTKDVLKQYVLNMDSAQLPPSGWCNITFWVEYMAMLKTRYPDMHIDMLMIHDQSKWDQILPGIKIGPNLEEGEPDKDAN